MARCRLCGDVKTSIFYQGPIRAGGVGSDTVDGYSVLECRSCSFVFLDPVPEQLDQFYESHEYRQQWDYEFSPEAIHAKYDHEQNERISRIGIQNLRGRSVLDLGASAGVFLDAIQSVSSRTIAVEPGDIYRDYLESRGHIYYPYPEDACNSNEKVDVVTSFDVIEHVTSPRDLVKSAFKLLKPGGTFILSMPNLHDLIRNVNRDTFDPFFFQIAHLNYFGIEVIPELFSGAGFCDMELDYLHKYNIDNLIRWAKYGNAGKVEEIEGLFDRTFNSHYRAEVERLGISSHLFIKAKKPI